MPKVLGYAHQCVDDADISAVAAVLEADYLTTGPRVEQFEKMLCEMTGAEHCIACANGTAALHLACMALGVGKGDIGLTSPISFLASANCIEYCGGRADFVDIDPETLCLSPQQLEAYCREHKPPKVVIPVDFAGLGADLAAMAELSKIYGFSVIEDAAHALGSFYQADGKQYACGSCTHTDLAVFSFHPVKTITTGEGGAVMTNDRALADRVRSLRNHGMASHAGLIEQHGGWAYEMTHLGFNYRITDIQCALGISQLSRLDGFRNRRRQIVSTYNDAFSKHEDLVLPPPNLSLSACPHLYPIRLKAGATKRRQVYEHLKADNIVCQVHYIPIYRQPYYADKYGYEKGRCPQAELYYSQALSLPLFPAMSDHDVLRVIEQFLIVLD
nr:UDP-4-amino-4,6-dideoxy-N-acetyl-beta-L-altrosamine transaminase [uncultured Desulfobacter sp.]